MNPNAISANPQPFAPPMSIVGQTNRAINSGQPAMQQLSAQSPNFNPNMMTPAPNPMPQKSPMDNFSQQIAQAGQQQAPNAPQNAPQGQNTPMTAQMKPPKNPLETRTDTIIKALVNHLESLDRAKEPQQTAQTQGQGGMQR